MGAQDKDKLRGINPIDVVFDEFAEMDKEIWTAIFLPILAENGGTATFIFTPKGKNHAWELIQKAKGSLEWFVQVMGVNSTEIFTTAQLDEIRRTTPQALYQQEYECSFIDHAGQYFRRIRENTYKPNNETTKGDFQIGVDLAKYQDWTVITPFNLNNFRVYPQDRFNQIDWNLQKARIQVAYFKFNDGEKSVCIDATGVGDPVVEDLKKEINIPERPFNHAFKFTEQSKKDLLKHLAILLEADKIKIPDDEDLIAELEAIRYELGEGGTLKIKTPDGITDDRVMSLALAVYGQSEKQQYISKENQPAYEEDKPMFEDIGI